MDWQPIETAPKDGSPILLFRPADGMWVAYWDSDFCEWMTTAGTILRGATHWMPQSPPPWEHERPA